MIPRFARRPLPMCTRFSWGAWRSVALLLTVGCGGRFSGGPADAGPIPDGGTVEPGHFYVDCQATTNGDGRSMASPWTSLSAVSAYVGLGSGFAPGDVIALRTGSTCVGVAGPDTPALHPLGSGTPDAPITLTSYQDGSSTALPVIDANEAYVGVQLQNQHDWIIENLEVHNAVFRNVWVMADQVGTFSDFTLRNLVAHDNNMASVNRQPHTSFQGAGGIIVEPCAVGTILDHVTVTGVTTYYNHDIGVEVGHDHRQPFVPGADAGQYAALPFCALPNPSTIGEEVTHVVIEDSESYGNDGAGIQVAFAGSASTPQSILLTRNNLHHNGGIQTLLEAKGPYTTPDINGEGAWWSNTYNLVASGNQSAFNKRGTTGDGGGLDADSGSVGSIIEGNWLHDNDGYGVNVITVYQGFITTHTTIRYNVMSENGKNGGLPDNGGDVDLQSAAGAGINLDGVYIYNNTMLRGSDGPGLHSDADFAGGSQNFFFNNLVYRNVSSDEHAQMMSFSLQSGAITEISAASNLYFNAGSVAPTGVWLGASYALLPFATYQSDCDCEGDSLYADPQLVDPGWDVSSWPQAPTFTLPGSSPAVGAGQPIDATLDPNGAPRVDFFGNPLPGVPSIGAFQ